MQTGAPLLGDTVTLTNNTRQIAKLSNDVVHFADEREYERAHCALDDIEAKVHKLRRHIERLQWIRIPQDVPAGD